MLPLNLSGAVLAGGQSSRMGRDKASLPCGDETLLARQLRLLAELGVTDRLVSLASAATVPTPDATAARLVLDALPGLGPLGGIAAVLAAARHDSVLVLAVDLPALDTAFLRELAAQASPDRGVVPVRDGRFEPLAAIYPRRALAEVQARLARRDLALQPLVRAGVAAGWLREFPVAPGHAGQFLNWNSPGDLPPSANFAAH